VRRQSGLSRRPQRLVAFFAALFFVLPAQGDSALTDQHFGGIGGVYHVESEEFEGEGLVEVLLQPIALEDFDLCLWFRTKALGDREWEYYDGYKCAPLRPFPSQSVGCKPDSHCFTANLSSIDYFFDFSSDYHLVDYIVWKSAAAEPDVFRLYRKQNEDYEAWLRELAQADLPQADNQSSFQMYGTGFVVSPNYVVTADHILRDKPSGRQCNRVDVLTYPDKKWTEGRIHGVNPVLDIAVIELSESTKPAASLAFAPRFDEGDPVSHYGFADWSAGDQGLEMSDGRIIPSQVKAERDLAKTGIFSDLPGQKGDSGGAMLDAHGNVMGVLLSGDEGGGWVHALKSTVLEGFLTANRVPFEEVRSTEVLTPAQIELKAKTFTAFVRCQHRIAILGERNKNLDADRR